MLQSYNNINTNGYYKPNVKDVKYHYENLELKDFLKVLPGKKEIDIYAERRGEKSWKCFCPLSHNHKVGYDVKPSLIPAEISVVIAPLAVMLVISVQVPVTLFVVVLGPV